MSINEAGGIVKVGKQWASQRIKPKKKTLLQKIKDKIKNTKFERDSDTVYLNTEEAPANSMGPTGVSGLGDATGGIAGMDPILGSSPRERKKKFKEFRRKALGEAVTTKPSGNGYHDVYVNGEKHPDYEVVNGAGGNASMGKQTYGIRKGDKVQWVGCLKDTRKRLNKMLGESGPLAGKPKKLEPLKDRLARVSKGAGPGAVNLNDWLADKKRRKAEYEKEREERMKNRERRDENT